MSKRIQSFSDEQAKKAALRDFDAREAARKKALHEERLASDSAYAGRCRRREIAALEARIARESDQIKIRRKRIASLQDTRDDHKARLAGILARESFAKTRIANIEEAMDKIDDEIAACKEGIRANEDCIAARRADLEKLAGFLE